MSFVHPIDRAWISTGDTGAQNYDEFADESEITAILTAQPFSALGVEMPHRAPQSQGASFLDSLDAAAERLASAKDAGRYVEAQDVVGVYRITDTGGAQALGLFAMVDTDEISTNAQEPGRVIRNEDVFVAKVAERVALARRLHHLLSPVLLLQTAGAAALTEALEDVVAAGPAAVRDEDQEGRWHEVWPVTGPDAVRLGDLAGAGELVVADGNHRSLAAQTGGMARFLAVITTPEALVIDPYQRLISSTETATEALLERLREAGAVVRPSEQATPTGGTVVLYSRDGEWTVRFADQPGEGDLGVAGLDHSLVESVLVSGALGLDPGDPAVRYIGGDRPDSWLREQVDNGTAQLAILIAPVTVEQFVQVNLDRQKMPRKSTWFTPKARAGLVLAEVDTNPA